MYPLITLNLDPSWTYNLVVLAIEIITFFWLYGKKVKKSVDQEDLKDLRSYVDQQDRGLHHRIDKIEERADSNIKDLRQMIMDIHTFLLGEKNEKNKNNN